MKMETTIRVAAIAATAVVAILMGGAIILHEAGAAPRDLATKYTCDEGVTMSVNYILGAQVAEFDGKHWNLVETLKTKARRDDGTEIPVTQYQFRNKGTDFYFVTGEGQSDTGALLLPNSDDLLFCEVTK